MTMGLREALRSEMLTLVIEQNADLRDRLALFQRFACRACGCAPAQEPSEWACAFGVEALCQDCCAVARAPSSPDSFGAHVSVGMRGLCGRKLLEVC